MLGIKVFCDYAITLWLFSSDVPVLRKRSPHSRRDHLQADSSVPNSIRTDLVRIADVHAGDAAAVMVDVVAHTAKHPNAKTCRSRGAG